MTLSEPSDEAVDGRAARWSGQRDKRRAEFVEAALQAIAEYGPQTSTEQVASYVGVTRTKLYRYFDGAADLHHSIAQRASDMLIAAQRPVWNPTGRPMDMITHSVARHLRWRVDHPNLYEYLTRHSLSDDVDGVPAIRQVTNAVATNMAGHVGGYFSAVGVDDQPVESLSFGAVGLVESATTHWLNSAERLPLAEFTAQVAEWIWALLGNALQSAGIRLDPHQPLAGSAADRRPPKER
jgi:AcrR family transcriptional regulator